ncbi:Ig-like domain-containing protein [Mucilaginibacter sp.]|uniref:Ig-like domain-containing protein n=1 Tax=Mucilaginibacter sp. TaxID=1882438 RepID=UPI002608D473|nr:Ig-like domain-containing protein [Mucilaginibacter sp.]MDB4924414.1 hypothetical protein [Mucilaginibacter sp.]
MTLNKKGVFFYKKLWLLVFTTLYFGCASIQKPQGGPRDRTPPKLLKATPKNQTHNFAAKQIQLDFDEYFKLTNQFQEITISPAPDKLPDFKVKQKSLVITFKDTLLKNTTYVINFGTAIRDVNEGNILKNFTYVFSTGTHIDSLSISGSVINSLTQKKEVLGPNENVTVMLFTLKQDSLLFGKKKPSVFTSVDSAGNFSLNNLKEGLYKIYALRETAPNKIYDNDNELIAFSKKTINLQHDTAGVRLKLFKQIPPKFRLAEKKFDIDGKMLFVFNKSLDKPSVRILYPPGLDEQKIVDISKTRDTVLIYSKKMDFDSVRVAFYDNNKPIDTTYLRKTKKETYTRNLQLKFGLSKNASVLKPGTDLHIYSNTPIASFDQSLVTLMEDSTRVNFTLTKDTGTTKSLMLKYRWRQKAAYTLTFNEGAVTSMYGDISKKQLAKFMIDNPEDYSTLTLKVSVPDTGRSYIVELLNEQKNVLRSDRVTKNTNIIYKNIYTGKFTVSVIYDDNKNGKYDPGSLKNKTQPENVWVYDKIFALRPNWEIDEPLVIPKEPTSP